MLLSDEDVLRKAQQWYKTGCGVAMATVIETWGSAPCSAGSHLVVSSDGRFVGSVSGGCIEAEIVTEALDVIAAGAPRAGSKGARLENCRGLSAWLSPSRGGTTAALA